MRKYISLLYMMLALMICSSCEDSLNLYPHSQVATESLSEKDIEAFVNGVYNRVQNTPTNSSYVMFDIIGGNLVRGGASGLGGYLEMINDILQPENGNIAAQWNGYYAAIYQVNNLIASTANMQNESRREEILGIAHFFRGYTYYNLVTRWGGVPIINSTATQKLPRNTEAEVWSFIETELQLAIDKAPTFGGYYYVSKDAAKALLARAKLAQGKKREAALLAEEVITSGRFQLDEFEKIFRSQQNTEVIFSFLNQTIESSINLSVLFYTYAHPVSGSYNYKPTTEVMNLFESTDKRRAISVDTYSSLDVINKYPSGQTGSDPIIVTRLAEMYLISAEGQGMAGISRLNELRNKRGLSSISVTNDNQYLEAVLLERRRELLGEGFRWYDLVRLGRAQQDIGLRAAQTKLPIPARELLLNTLLEPNDGY
ncbi:RagB/SusD domain protein [Pseudopedobacter saltans DSM 12145]|uniref:RagB/SusD domain protein n=1 Tax=Pseudopedobacter saltans (strain ATCC 51119 / DSM 12145 / JCM 21818 / CCUG 39354 / LMG 10337 / NBRC 100064 / NCIMB 13643) TaxID=762903 RepID=F0S5Y5_PSESL|nr:RagB/SusD family nutrient uptake outer membrane protein [Pseudopedobacter saltans]ADY52088.1 RagB/SusD domain protein [Pseudopedobacter saltans DSM 12145]